MAPQFVFLQTGKSRFHRKGNAPMSNETATAPRDWTLTLILSIFVGTLGIDRMFIGKWGTGILKLITGGGLGVWWIIDIIIIATGNMRDKWGRELVK